jgi:hypothetical protein
MTVSRAKGAKDAKVMGQSQSSRANARDLRKISPFGRNDKRSFFASLACLARQIYLQWFYLTFFEGKNLTANADSSA